MRLELFPYLKEHFNPRIAQSLHERAAYFRELDQLLDELTGKACADVLRSGESGVYLDAVRWKALPDAVARSVVCRAVEMAGGRVEWRRTCDILEMLGKGQTGKRIDIGNGRTAALSYDIARFGTEELSMPFAIPLPIGGELVTPSGWRIGATYDSVPPGAASVRLEADRIRHPALTVRSRRDGDVFFPSGMRKKLKDFFIDEKIPRAERERVPLVCDGDDIIWVCPIRFDSRFCADERTKKSLTVWAKKCEMGENKHASGFGTDIFDKGTN